MSFIPVQRLLRLILRGRKPVVDGDGEMVSKSLPKGRISARHFHADTGEWEDLGVISKPGRE